MKTVYLIRHAKSSWSDYSLRDIERPLNNRGKRDAPFMAKLLKGKGVQVDGILSSPANRALTTAGYFARELGIKKEGIIIQEAIYEAYPEVILNVIQKVDDDMNTILLFGHNPSFTSVANLFSERYISNLPTCGIVKVEANIQQWEAFSAEVGKMTALHYPKQYFQ